jgi:hypothetical protein
MKSDHIHCRSRNQFAVKKSWAHYYYVYDLEFGLENREYGLGDPLCSPRDTLYLQKLTLTLPTVGGRSVGIVRLQTKATEFIIIIIIIIIIIRFGISMNSV